MPESDSQAASIEIGPADPSEGDVVFASIDAVGTHGYLNDYVFSALGYEDPQFPGRKELQRGFAVVRDGEKPPVVLIVTVGTSYSTQQALRTNLARVLKERNADFVGRTLWIPLMGTGDGLLSHSQSLSATLDAIRESSVASGQGPDRILLATPPDIGEDEFAELREKVASHMDDTAASDDAPPTPGTKRRPSTKARKKPGAAKRSSKKKEPIGEPKKALPTTADLAPFYPDHPAEHDALGRVAVAETLATIIRDVFSDPEKRTDEEVRDPDQSFIVRILGKWGSGKTSILNFLRLVLRPGKALTTIIRNIVFKTEKRRNGQKDVDRTFMIHIHGKWGSGKTSILNFLRRELQSGEIKDLWVVVDYNAWRNQKNGPAWWTLLTEVYQQAIDQLQPSEPDTARELQYSEWSWRFRSGWAPYIIAFAALLWLVTVIAAVSNANFKDTLTVLATVFTVWGGFSAFSRTSQVGSARTASTFLELSRDPLRPLTRRYEELISEITRPVAVFIDDLDRCDPEFVVELIQSIQTLFRKAPVAYVVAADRNWVCTSYEKAYADFVDRIREPGRPLGHLFLEKIFQLSISVPTLSRSIQKEYWDRLLLSGGAEERSNVEHMRMTHRETLAKLHSDQDVRQHLDSIADVVERRVAGGLAFSRLQDEDLRKQREHFLQGYSDIVEPNPRAMKRLLNAYGFKLGFEMMGGVSTSPDSLVRWTIMELRWPLLAEYLAKHPDKIDSVCNGPAPEDLDDDLAELIGNAAIKTVAGDLDQDIIRSLTGGETGQLEAQATTA